MTFDMGLVINIKALRLERGLTQQQLADLVGISSVHVSQIERGVKNLNNRLMERFSQVLGVLPEDLISGPEKTSVKKLAAILDQLSDEDRQRVEAFAEALRDSRAGTS